MATVGTLASGAMQNLIHRAASVAMKERRKLVLVPRETPLSSIHLRGLATLHDAGADDRLRRAGLLSPPVVDRRPRGLRRRALPRPDRCPALPLRPLGWLVSAPAESSPAALKRLVDGYRVSQAISATVSLGVPDLLGDGSATSAELAAATGADEATLYRVLRALASAGVLTEEDGRRFALTELGRPLRTDSPDSLAGWAEFIGRPHEWQAWSGLADAVRTGKNAFTSVHGMDVWTHRAQTSRGGRLLRPCDAEPAPPHDGVAPQPTTSAAFAGSSTSAAATARSSPRS